MDNKINIKNKKASFEYEFVDKYTAGIKLSGTEIKAIREGKANITDGYCVFENHELWVKGLHISEYTYGTYSNHDPRADRKLLLNRKELNKLEKRVNEKGLTIIATRLFVTERGLAKLDIALARGKKQYDKREDIKKKDVQRDLDRVRKF